MRNGPTPPHDLDAEQSVLGSILLDADALAKVVGSLRPEHFYRENNGLIFRASQELFARGEPIDNVTVAAVLERQGVLERCGGRAQLAQIQELVPTAAHVEHYAKIVREKAIWREGIKRAQEVLKRGFSEEGESAEQFVAWSQQQFFELAIDDSAQRFERLGERQVTALVERLEARKEQGGLAGLSCGFVDVDRITGGFKASELTIVGARPSMGKTSWVLNLARHVAEDVGLSVGIFSVEMGLENLTERLAAQIAGVDSTKMQDGSLSASEWDALYRCLDKLEKLPIYIDDSSTLSSMEMLVKARQLHQRLSQTEVPLGVVIVDYIQMMRGSKADENRVQEVGEIVQACRVVARELRIPVIAVSQLSRALEMRNDKRPILSDLRESGEIEQVADVVIFIYRDDYYNPNTEEPGIAEFHVAKNRNGRVATVKLRWRKEVTQFQNLSLRPAPPVLASTLPAED